MPNQPANTNVIHYFAYGSNMSTRRLRARVASANVRGVAELKGYRLSFRKIGRDASAKCDLERTGDPRHRVIGVVFSIDSAHKEQLDEAEDLGRGYDIETLELQLQDGTQLTAFSYRAILVDPSLKPYPWYRHHVEYGAREHWLPLDYVAEIVATETAADPDPARQRREMAIYAEHDQPQT